MARYQAKGTCSPWLLSSQAYIRQLGLLNALLMTEWLKRRLADKVSLSSRERHFPQLSLSPEQHSPPGRVQRGVTGKGRRILEEPSPQSRRGEEPGPGEDGAGERRPGDICLGNNLGWEHPLFVPWTVQALSRGCMGGRSREPCWSVSSTWDFPGPSTQPGSPLVQLLPKDPARILLQDCRIHSKTLLLLLNSPASLPSRAEGSAQAPWIVSPPGQRLQCARPPSLH